LAMASGVLEEATCEGYGALGCVVAIKHDIGGSVLVYAHLEQSSVQTVKRVFDHGMSTGTPVWVAQGTIIGKAGNTWGQESIHLHIDLRDGSRKLFKRSFVLLAGGLGGNPIGWGDLLPFVDGYRIASYLVDGEGTLAYNYDGSAIKGDVDVIINFPYLDWPGNVSRRAIVRVDPSFECDPESLTCEDNAQSELTQFAGGGSLGGGATRMLQVEDTIEGKVGGELISTNTPLTLESPSPSCTESAQFISDITLPDDGPPLAPGQNLIKTWRVRNSGTCTWDSHMLKFVGGDQMNAPSPVDVPYTAPGNEVEISVPIQVPDTSATGYWQIVNANGTWVPGRFMWVMVEVPSGAEPTPPPKGEDVIELECLDCPGVVKSRTRSSARPSVPGQP